MSRSHIDRLEMEMVSKHQCVSVEFYYVLHSTLLGKTLTALHVLEQDVDRLPISQLIPDWFETETEEWRQISTGQSTFVLLKTRTKLTVLVVLFYSRYQRSSITRPIIHQLQI